MAVRVGIIANPAAGKDVRRIVTEATIVTAPEKVALLRRALAGLAATPVDEVLYLRDGMRLVERALDGLPQARRPSFAMHALDLEIRHSARDTAAAAALLARADVGGVLVIGGDGTNRVVAGEIGEIPLLPVSTGTNNAFPHWTEATAAGLALGFAAAGGVGDAVQRRKRIEIRRGPQLLAIALVDAVVLREGSGAAGAVWDPGEVEMIIATQGLPETVGWSAAVGAAMPVGVAARYGALLRLDETSERRLSCPIAPGLIAELGVGELRRLPLGEPVPVRGPRTIALDGEPLVRLAAGEEVGIAVTERGPNVIDIALALRLAAEAGRFWRGPAR